MFARSRLLTPCWFFGSICAIALAQDPEPIEEQVPQHFTGDTELSYAANPAFDLAGSGTIEFYVAPGWLEKAEYYPCILACGHGTDPKTRYSIKIGPEGESIGLWNGRKWEQTAFVFEPGVFHHVALVTQKGQTEIFVDGQSTGILPIGYGDFEGGHLFVGSQGGLTKAFMGAIANLRIWNRALSVETLREIAEHWGPSDKPELAGALVGFSYFTTTAQEFRVLPPVALLPEGHWTDDHGREIDLVMTGRQVVATPSKAVGEGWTEARGECDGKTIELVFTRGGAFQSRLRGTVAEDRAHVEWENGSRWARAVDKEKGR